jgi:HEPN domain-containing protein
MDDRLQYWLDLADYDLETAKAMIQTGRNLYVGFMCSQSVEKMLKAYIVGTKKETPPFKHNLSLLALKADIFDLMSEEQRNFINLLEPLQVEARYPTSKKRLMESLTPEVCVGFIKKTTELNTWIRNLLLKK